jgi:hypothetical protein
MTELQLTITCGWIELGLEGAILKSGQMGDGFYVQIRFPSQAPFDGCRKWYVSSHATISEVVQTVFLAALTAQEHELRERFRFMGRDIFNPHQDATDLATGNPIPHDVRD